MSESEAPQPQPPPPGRPVYVIAAEACVDGVQTVTIQTPERLEVGTVLVLYTYAEVMPEWLAYLKT